MTVDPNTIQQQHRSESNISREAQIAQSTTVNMNNPNETIRAFSSESRPFSVSSRNDLNLPTLRQFFDPSSPWVLVHEGSLMGYFDFVPRYLRVGPWTVFVPIFISIVVAKLIYWMPHQHSFHLNDDEILSTHPMEYSAFWIYNLMAFVWMKMVLFSSLRKRGPGIVLTYTIQSWIMLIIRHGLSALAPFLPNKHFLLWVNELLRFPALATASITFFYWNFIIAPVIGVTLPPERRRAFLQFNFSLRLIQLHFFNIIFAILNTVVTSSRVFQFVDLWCALVGAIGYALMYVLVLDRIGVHLYPVFSPRTLWSVLSWTAMFATYFAVFHFWNHIISSDRLSLLL